MVNSCKCILFFFMDRSRISATLAFNVSPTRMPVDCILHICATNRGRIGKRPPQHDAQHAWTFVARVSSGALQHEQFQQQARGCHANCRASTSANFRKFRVSKQGGGAARYFQSGSTEHSNFHSHFCFYNKRAGNNGASFNVAVACQSCSSTQSHMLPC